MIYSHFQPDILLEEHIAQVLSASYILWGNHSKFFRDRHPELFQYLEKVARLHDTGKASKYFQKYIKNPKNYKGNKKQKAHTAPSTWIAWQESMQKKEPVLDALCKVIAVLGHHQGLHTQEEWTGIWKDYTTVKFLSEQIESINFSELEKSIAYPLSIHQATEENIWNLLDYIEENVLPYINGLRLDHALKFRIQCQILLSMLLEADKAFLAVSESYRSQYAAMPEREWKTSLVQEYIKKNCRSIPSNLDRMRSQIQAKIIERIPSQEPIQSLTLPTGMGKTMAAALWAFAHWERLPEEYQPKKIILVLPYLSIIDQTVRIYRDMLQDYLEPCAFLTSHSMSERIYDSEMDSQSNDFFIDTWKSSILVTTFDQFLLTLMHSAPRYQMRFHNLCDALIIFDEIQAIPCKLWHPLDNLLRNLAETCNTHILAMSATQPGFLSTAKELIENPEQIFQNFQRYKWKIQCHEKITLSLFLEGLKKRYEQWQGQRVLITMNTRKSARAVVEFLEQQNLSPIYFITADVIPEERLEMIQKIKQGKPCIVVSTQCIEAGVDIDMDILIRDMAPLDSLIQISGRCNREGKKSRCDVEIVYLTNEKKISFASMVYDKILLEQTEILLQNFIEVKEEETFDLCRQYFQALFQKKNLGQEITENLAYFKNHENPQKYLRGDRKQLEFLVVEKNPTLELDIQNALSIEDRWERRRTLLRLSGVIHQFSISIFPPADFNPETIAIPKGPFWFLKKNYYIPYRGLKITEGEELCTQIF